ncbi:MAG TPA: O-antigen ligase family protein [Candidatus Baltobacteraceae bacterium]|nr:O-antigen ligase family protein [Candidatus Baltobacteraceae bacterium]
MSASWQRGLPAAFALAYACVPLFPIFITLTSVDFPGISLLPVPVALALLGVMVLIALYVGAMLLAAPREKPPLLAQMLAWFGSALLAALLGFNPHDGLLFVGIVGLGVIWYCAIVRYYRVPGVARAIYWSYLVSGLLASAVAVVMVIARHPAAQYTIGHGRAIGTFILPGELAGYLIVFLPIAFALTRVARSRALRAIAVAALVTGALAMLLTFSRAGWMGLASAVAVFAAMRARSRHAALALLIGILGAALVAVLLVFNAHHDPSENYTRLSIWQTAIGVIDRFPFTGVGPFGFSRLYALLRLPDGDATAFHAHSVYLTFLAELGIVGASAVAWTFWSFGLELRRRLSAATPGAALLATAVAAGLIGTLVQGLIDTVSVVIFGLWFPTLALALVAARSATEDA